MALVGFAGTGFSEMTCNVTFGERVSRVLEHKKRSRAWLAQELGISKQAIQYTLDKAKKPTLLLEIADILQVSSSWLSTGEGAVTANDFAPHQVPFFSMIELQEPKATSIVCAKQTIASSPMISRGCFATSTHDESMLPLFPPRSILVFDPAKTPKTGDYILSLLVETRQVLFRQYIRDSDDFCLKPINICYPSIINKENEVLGVLVESRTVFS